MSLLACIWGNCILSRVAGQLRISSHRWGGGGGGGLWISSHVFNLSNFSFQRGSDHEHSSLPVEYARSQPTLNLLKLDISTLHQEKELPTGSPRFRSACTVWCSFAWKYSNTTAACSNSGLTSAYGTALGIVRLSPTRVDLLPTRRFPDLWTTSTRQR